MAMCGTLKGLHRYETSPHDRFNGGSGVNPPMNGHDDDRQAEFHLIGLSDRGASRHGAIPRPPDGRLVGAAEVPQIPDGIAAAPSAFHRQGALDRSRS